MAQNGKYEDYIDAFRIAVSGAIEKAHAVYDRLYAEYIALVDHFGRGGNDVMKRLRAISAESKLRKSHERNS